MTDIAALIEKAKTGDVKAARVILDIDDERDTLSEGDVKAILDAVLKKALSDDDDDVEALVFIMHIIDPAEGDLELLDSFSDDAADTSSTA